MNLPLISVCIAVYNGEKYIRRAIESVLNQTHQNFEIIVINDGSTDGTSSILLQFEDPRITIHDNITNKGVSFTRNRYLSLVKGDFIAILDADDTWSKDKLQKQIQFFEENADYGLCGTFARKIFPDNTTSIWSYPKNDIDIRFRLMWGSSIVHSSLMVKSEIIKAHNITYNELLNPAEDYDFIRQIIKQTKAHNISKPLVNYLMHEGQLTQTQNSRQIDKSVIISHSYITKNLKIPITDKESKVIEKTFRYQYPLSSDELGIIADFFLSCQKKIHNNHNFQKKWKEILFHSSSKGIQTWLIKSKYNSLKLNISSQIKLFIKCLLKK